MPAMPIPAALQPPPSRRFAAEHRRSNASCWSGRLITYPCAALPPRRSMNFETPLGHVSIDASALAKVVNLPFVVRSDAPHAPEHALEVELPFLQMLLSSFRIVPLIVGDVAAQSVAEVLRILWGGPETLIVVSSDLSHYHGYETARRLDAATAATIERGDWVSLRPEQACGWLAVAGLLIEATRRGLTAERLALCNSGDTAGSRDSVVGYGAWMLASGAL